VAGEIILALRGLKLHYPTVSLEMKARLEEARRLLESE
jgi:hypothetical protein